jgi:signal transduction histidine kinase/ActR/RegA family two-component response regulator
MTIRILSVSVQSEFDVVSARQRARKIAQLCGFGVQDQARIATSVSELARNLYSYAIGGKVHFAVEGSTVPQVLHISVVDQGPGITNLDSILSGHYQSSTGMGMGILGARRLMDRFEVTTSSKGTLFTLQKILPQGASLITARVIGEFCNQLATLPTDNSMQEIQQQNQELLATLAELKTRQDDLLLLTRELEDTNRGVVALYAELDEKADHLRRADEMKSRFLSNMSHEFRTPLSSIRALAKLLLDHVDGDLTIEQEKQVSFIIQSALSLNELVNDLLDIAKIEAGKVVLRVQPLDVSEMFSALRGMLRPLLVGDSVTLIFIEPETPLKIQTDEAKLSQILRNFISNALKFTESGEIVVSAVRKSEGEGIRFSVSDTGVGIEAKDLELIFEEFSQLENPLQRKVKGTGLGLPLCKKLATLLQGKVQVESTPASGSVFSVILPEAPSLMTLESHVHAVSTSQFHKMADKFPVLLIEDNAALHLLYKKFLINSEFQLVVAHSVREADELWPLIDPAAVVLDIVLFGEAVWPWLAALKNDLSRKATPVIVVTEIEDSRKGFALGADAYFTKPLHKQQLLTSLRDLIRKPGSTSIDAGMAASHKG